VRASRAPPARTNHRAARRLASPVLRASSVRQVRVLQLRAPLAATAARRGRRSRTTAWSAPLDLHVRVALASTFIALLGRSRPRREWLRVPSATQASSNPERAKQRVGCV
jgi:hypothetical protein